MLISNNASLAGRLLRVVLAIYLSMAIILTLGQLVLEYQNERKRLTQEVENAATTFAPIISKTLWSVDEEQTKAALQGVLGINNDVLNVKLLDTSGNLMYEYSATQDKHRLFTQWPWIHTITKPFLEYYVFEYKLSYQSGVANSQAIGSLILASNSDVVLNRAAHTFLITILSALVKTAILSLIFYFIVRSMVGRPLLSITHVIQSLTPQEENQPHTHSIDPQMLERSDELGLMARSFIKMTRALQQKDEALNSYSQDLEAKVHERTAQLEQVSQAKSDFLAAVSHEIRTPMNGVIGLAHLLGETQLNEQQRQYVTTIQQSGESLTKLINEILDHLKLESNKIELEYSLFNPEAILHESAGLFIQQARHLQVPLSIIYAPDCPTQLEGDAVRLRQILVNLLGNAFKFTQSGRIIIKAEMVPVLADGCSQEMQFSVVDTGIGIDENQLQRLFKPFSQADSSTTRRYGGTGLGLAICKQLVELMGGSIGVTSQPGQGSEFWFRLPARNITKSREIGADACQQYTLYLLLLDAVLRQHLVLLLNDYAINVKCIEHLEECDHQMPQVTAALIVMDMAGGYCQGVNVERSNSTKAEAKIPRLVIVAEDCMAKNRTGCFAADVALIAAPFTNGQFIQALIALAAGVQPVAQPQKIIKTYADYSGLKVLVAEDNAVNQMVILGYLKKYSIDPIAVENGRLAVDYCKDNDKNIDLILMDGEMPVMDGWQAADAIRKLNIRASNNKPVVIVAMTAHAVAFYEEKAALHGMNHFLSKPIKPMALEAILSNCMEQVRA